MFMTAGKIRASSLATPAVATFRSRGNSAANGTPYSFASLSIGPAYTNRRIVVVVWCGGEQQSAAVRTISSVVVGGQSTTDVTQLASQNNCGIFITTAGALDTGTTATVTFTGSPGVVDGWGGVAVYDLNGGSLAALDTYSSNSKTAAETTFSVPPGGVVIGGGAGYQGTIAATNTTADTTGAIEGTSFGSAFSNNVTNGGVLTHTFSGFGSVYSGQSIAMWGP